MEKNQGAHHRDTQKVRSKKKSITDKEERVRGSCCIPAGHSCWADHKAKLERAKATGYASRKMLPRMRKDVSPQIQEEQTPKRIN